MLLQSCAAAAAAAAAVPVQKLVLRPVNIMLVAQHLFCDAWLASDSLYTSCLLELRVQPRRSYASLAAGR